MPWTASGGFTTPDVKPWFAYAPGLAQNNVASETNDAQSLLSYYRSWIAARKRSTALLKGDLEVLGAPAQSLAFLRTSGTERVLVVHNLGSTAVNAGPFDIAASKFDTVYADSGVADPTGGNGRWLVMLPPHSSGVWRARDVGVASAH